MTAIAIILILIIIWMIFGERIKLWIQTFMAHRAEDAFRRMMGMPSRKEQRKAEKRTREQSGKRNDAYSDRQRSEADNDGPLIPKEYAEDVEYVEIRDYSHTETIAKDAGGNTIYHESQVEEAIVIEYTENKS